MAPGLDRFWKVIAIPEVGPSIVIDSTMKSLDVAFTVDSSWKRDPDTCNLRIMNCNQTTRAYLEANAVIIQLYAGRTYPPPLIFQGEISDSDSHKDDEFTTWITEIEADDTAENFRVTPVPLSFGKGVLLSNVIQLICAGSGLIPDVIISDKAITSPLSFVSSPRKALNVVCQRYSLRYQIKDGKCIVRGLDVPLNVSEVPVMSYQTGLIGVPSARRENKKLKVVFRHMLEPRLKAGGLCSVVTDSFSKKGLSKVYFLERVTHNSDADEQFDTECECRVYP
jgi:hypothetical protein